MPIGKYLSKKNIDFIHARCDKIDAENSKLELSNGDTVDYDYLVLATGPKLYIKEVEGSGPENHTRSVCTVTHAEKFKADYDKIIEKGSVTILVGAAPFASCFGPAYEFAMIADADLSRRKIRDKVHIAFVTSEPYIMSVISYWVVSVIPRGCWNLKCAVAIYPGLPMRGSPNSRKAKPLSKN